MLTRETMPRKLHVRDEFYRRRARQSFAEFLRYTKPDYQLSWFHEELAVALDGFLDDENRAKRAAAINTLEHQIPGIKKVSPSESKYDGAFASSDELNGCNWYLPHPQIAPWVDTFLFELSAFPRGKDDDWLDSWTQAREALSDAGISDYSMFTAENVLRLEEFYRRQG